MAIRPERRLPFGFRGDWGQVYKRYVADEDAEIEEEKSLIYYERNCYAEIDGEVQFKQIGGVTEVVEQPLDGLKVPVLYLTAETTDSYFDNGTKAFRCVVEIGDVVRLFGQTWTVTGVREEARFSPRKMSFYYCDLKSIQAG